MIVCCSEGGFLERKPSSAAATTIATIKETETSAAVHPSLPPKMIGYMDDDSVTEQSFELPAYNNELLVGGALLFCAICDIFKWGAQWSSGLEQRSLDRDILGSNPTDAASKLEQVR